ncbi:restriction endonuclease subunit S [Microcoleus sp. Pol12B4]|uniref:restriction endonuclease subunit S n=1 Tax=Microcoleus sp. Pol12B4 TaxID=3055395 RepID=UPI002FD3CB2A
MMISENRKLPDGWRRVELGEITLLVQNGVYKPAEKYGHGYPLLRMYNIQTTSFNLTFEPLARVLLDEQELETYKLETGDVLVSRVNSFELVGKSAWVSPIAESYVFENMLIRLRFNDSVDSLFVALQMGTQAVRRQIEGFAKRASGQASINSSDIRNIQIVLPPLSYQKRVAAIAQKADRLRRTRRYALQLSDTYLRSVFLEMFGDPIANPKGWEIVKLSSLGELDRGRSKHRPRNAPKLFGGSYPFIQTGDVANSAGYIRTYKQTYSELGLKQSKLWAKGTLCITIAANIAKTGILTFDACFPDSIVGFSPNDKTNTEVIQQWFNFIQQNLEETAPESAQKNINLEILRNLDLPIPPLPLQEKFAQIVQKFERLRTQQREADRQAEHLFQTLLHRAFRGELTSQNADDEPESVLLEDIRAQQAKAEAKAKTATQAMGEAADYLGTKAKQQDIEPIQLKFPGFE